MSGLPDIHPHAVLYTVRFELQGLTGRPSRDAVTADLHEDWLEPANPNR
jgi:hypothetical protein